MSVGTRELPCAARATVVAPRSRTHAVKSCRLYGGRRGADEASQSVLKESVLVCSGPVSAERGGGRSRDVSASVASRRGGEADGVRNELRCRVFAKKKRRVSRRMGPDESRAELS